MLKSSVPPMLYMTYPCTRHRFEESIAEIGEKANTARKVRPAGHIKTLQTKITKNMNRLCRKRPPYITSRMPIRLVKDPKIDKETEQKPHVKFDSSPYPPNVVR